MTYLPTVVLVLVTVAVFISGVCPVGVSEKLLCVGGDEGQVAKIKETVVEILRGA